MDALIRDIASAVSRATGATFTAQQQNEASGGCINHALFLTGDTRRYFVKTNRASRIAMFEAEAEGLDEILQTNTLRAPRPICHGTSGNTAFLVLESLEFGGTGDAAEMGHRLAALHRHCADRFGWKRNNTIGSTPQDNTWANDWVDFWRDCRLGAQLKLAQENGLSPSLQKLGEPLLEVLPAFFSSYAPAPSLLHGDLWGGNAAFLRTGEPVVFDPAVYYGDRETDLAMTELFGGFPSRFYAAYRETWPLDAGYTARKSLYNLYHLLNHANLFGGTYLHQSEAAMRKLLAAL